MSKLWCGLDKHNQQASVPTTFISSKSHTKKKVEKKIWEVIVFLMLETYRVKEREFKYHLKILKNNFINMSSSFILLHK